MAKTTKAEHKKIAADLYKKLEVAVAALDRATTITAEDKAEARIKALEDKIAEQGKPKKKEEEEDELVCPECGGDVYEVEDGAYFCEECKKYFEEE